MTIQEQIDALKKEFETKIAELEKQAKAEEKQRKGWKLKKDERYCVLTEKGCLTGCVWTDSDYDKKVYERGVCFKTEEEAEWEDEHRLVATELKRFVQEKDSRPITEEDWKNKALWKYAIRYDYCKGEWTIFSLVSTKSANEIYASNEAVLRQAIAHIGEERLKKYYFGVE